MCWRCRVREFKIKNAKWNGGKDSGTSVDEGDSHASLSRFLDQVHKQMPNIPEEEAEKDIAEAVRAVRASSRSGEEPTKDRLP
jgi:hypothetical protein